MPSCQHSMCFARRIQNCGVSSHSVAGNVLRTARLKQDTYSNAALEPWYTFERGVRAMVHIRTRGSNHGAYSNAAFEPWYTVERRVLNIGNLRMPRSTVNSASRVSNATVTTVVQEGVRVLCYKLVAAHCYVSTARSRPYGEYTHFRIPRRGPTACSLHRCSRFSRLDRLGIHSDAPPRGLMQPPRRSDAPCHLLRQ